MDIPGAGVVQPLETVSRQERFQEDFLQHIVGVPRVRRAVQQKTARSGWCCSHTCWMEAAGIRLFRQLRQSMNADWCFGQPGNQRAALAQLIGDAADVGDFIGSALLQ